VGAAENEHRGRPAGAVLRAVQEPRRLQGPARRIARPERHASRIERGRLTGTNAHLGRLSALRPLPAAGEGSQLIFEQPAAGPIRARPAKRPATSARTAKGENFDEDRGPMMRSGVWVPEGCGCQRRQGPRGRRARQPPGGGRCGAASPRTPIGSIGKPLRDGGATARSFRASTRSRSPGASSPSRWSRPISPREEAQLGQRLAGRNVRARPRTQTWETLGER
jgi:hypothetical protein